MLKKLRQFWCKWFYGPYCNTHGVYNQETESWTCAKCGMEFRF